MNTDPEVLPVPDKKNKGGRPLNSIWEDINKGNSVGSGKFSATCKYCGASWKRGEISKLENHLSNYCKDAPATVVRKYMSKVMERQDKTMKKRKISEQQNIDDFHDSTDLPEARITRINRALIKFFVACGIPFRIVEHPFFINLIKELNGGYDPPSREILAEQMLERELAQVNSKIKSEIDKETNLTIAFDGWTSHTHRSVWNFIIMTPSRKEYLYQLSDLSDHSHTAEYLSSVIEKVITDIGADRVSAIVSDNASNVKKAREFIQNKFQNIENVHCIAHCINLIACDIVKENFGDCLLQWVNILATFFRSSHQANSKLNQLIKEKGVVGGGLKLYCKTRWTTASESINSVISLESILEEMVADHQQLLTNDKIEKIINSRNFFSDLRILAFVLDPLKKAVLALEARSATLADCFLSLAQLAAVLNKLPKSFNPSFRSHCVKVINERFNEFDDDNYITCFFLDPRIRGAPLKKISYKRIIKCIMSIGKRLGFDLYEIDILLSQLQKYKNEEDPFDLDTSIARNNPISWWKLIVTDPEPELLPKIACHLLSICPNSATCERGFSTLGWLFERRLNLKLDTLESMCKLITYWKSNFKTELGCYGIDQKKNIRLTDDEINIRIAEAFKETDEEEDDDLSPINESNEPFPKDNCYVLIEHVWIDKFIDLSHEFITKDIDVPKDILDDFDEHMKDNDDDDRVGDDSDDSRKGYYDYEIEDVLGSEYDDEEEEK